MLTFCTLFDSNYLSRGIVTYYSLVKSCPSFHLYIFAFDQVALEILKKLNLPHTTIISLDEFEDEDLLRIKPTRTAGEYCWTCTPSTIKFVLDNFKTEHCTYIDADLFFYSNPQVLIDEMGENSVLITSHRYTKKYDQSKKSGEYCVQFMTFKNNENGSTVLDWWRNACIEWCYARHEDGKFGDQKYLDDWLTRFKGIHELKHLGGGVAPWNVQQYLISKNDYSLVSTDIKSSRQFSLVFFHFHQLKLLENNRVDLCRYELSNSARQNIYYPYVSDLLETDKQLKVNFPKLLGKGIVKNSFTWKTPLVYIKRKLRKEYNIFDPNQIV